MYRCASSCSGDLTSSRSLLGGGSAETVPPIVRDAIAAERRRLSAESSSGRAASSAWIEWLEHLPWTRRHGGDVDLARVRRELDAAHAGLEGAKASVIEYLAVRRRVRERTGAVLCLAGPPGVGDVVRPGGRRRPPARLRQGAVRRSARMVGGGRWRVSGMKSVTARAGLVLVVPGDLLAEGVELRAENGGPRAEVRPPPARSGGGSAGRTGEGGVMATSFRLVPGPVPAAARPRPAAEVSVERENARFLESTLVALLGSVSASRVQVVKDFADLERRASSALDVAVRVREAVEAGGPASRESWADIEYEVAEIHAVLNGRAAGAHRSIAGSAADMVEAAFEVARFAAGRRLSAGL